MHFALTNGSYYVLWTLTTPSPQALAAKTGFFSLPPSFVERATNSLRFVTCDGESTLQRWGEYERAIAGAAGATVIFITLFIFVIFKYRDLATFRRGSPLLTIAFYAAAAVVAGSAILWLRPMTGLKCWVRYLFFISFLLLLFFSIYYWLF